MSGLSFPASRDFPDPGVEPASPAFAGGFFTTASPGKPHLPYSGSTSIFQHEVGLIQSSFSKYNTFSS